MIHENERYSALRARLLERIDVSRIATIVNGIGNSRLSGGNSSYSETFNGVTEKASGGTLKGLIEEIIRQQSVIYCADLAGTGSPFIDYPDNIRGVSVSLELEDLGLPKFKAWTDYPHIQHIISGLEDPKTWHSLHDWVNRHDKFDLVFYRPIGDPVETFRATDILNYVEEPIDIETDIRTYYLQSFVHYLRKLWILMKPNSYLYANLSSFSYQPYLSVEQIGQLRQIIKPPSLVTVDLPQRFLVAKRSADPLCLSKHQASG